MKREEMVELRKEVFDRLVQMRRADDFAAGAAWNRATAETQLKLIDHLLERMRAPQ